MTAHLFLQQIWKERREANGASRTGLSHEHLVRHNYKH